MPRYFPLCQWYLDSYPIYHVCVCACVCARAYVHVHVYVKETEKDREIWAFWAGCPVLFRLLLWICCFTVYKVPSPDSCRKHTPPQVLGVRGPVALFQRVASARALILRLLKPFLWNSCHFGSLLFLFSNGNRTQGHNPGPRGPFKLPQPSDHLFPQANSSRLEWEIQLEVPNNLTLL